MVHMLDIDWLTLTATLDFDWSILGYFYIHGIMELLLVMEAYQYFPVSVF